MQCFAPVGFAIMNGNLTLLDGAEKKKMLFMLFISWLPPVFLLILKHTHWMYGQKSKWLRSIYIICHAHGKEIAVKELRPMFRKGKKVRPKLSGLWGGRLLNDFNDVMVNDGVCTSTHWGMLLWRDKRNWLMCFGDWITASQRYCPMP